MDKPWLKEYDSGVPPAIDYPKVPLHQFLLDAAAKYPDKPALVFGSVVEPLGNRLMDASMTYRQILELTQQFAAALQGLGVQKGDRVAVHGFRDLMEFVAPGAELELSAVRLRRENRNAELEIGPDGRGANQPQNRYQDHTDNQETAFHRSPSCG